MTTLESCLISNLTPDEFRVTQADIDAQASFKIQQRES